MQQSQRLFHIAKDVPQTLRLCSHLQPSRRENSWSHAHACARPQHRIDCSPLAYDKLRGIRIDAVVRATLASAADDASNADGQTNTLTLASRRKAPRISSEDACKPDKAIGASVGIRAGRPVVHTEVPGRQPWQVNTERRNPNSP